MKRVKRPRSAGPRALERTIARSLAYLRAHPVESVQAGLAAFLPASGGASRHRFLSNLVATESPEGHWHHSLADTAWNLRLLHDLGEHRTPGVYRAVEWIFSTQGQPGAYARGCSEASHRDRICEHFFGPCFSPGEPQLSSARFPNGAEIASDAGARFLISNVALEALLRWGYDRDPRLERYLESLRNFPRLFSRFGGMFAPVLMVSVLAVLLRDRHPRSKKQAGNLLRLLAKLQNIFFRQGAVFCERVEFLQYLEPLDALFKELPCFLRPVNAPYRAHFFLEPSWNGKGQRCIFHKVNLPLHYN